MKQFAALVLPILAACFAAPALAQGEEPASCKPKVAGVALALADEADTAQLQCDVDRAAILETRSDVLFGPVTNPLVRIVDTAAPSGAAYVYALMDVQGAMILDARSVPADLTVPGRVPVCHLRTLVPEAVSRQVSIALLETASPDVPGYAERMEVVTNPDGSRRSVLLLDSHDVITRIQTASGERNFSRHIRQTDKVAKLNELIIGVANVSDGWECNAS
ncbi:MAG: hypothetical protein R3C08_01700 [Hyphomonas sp.]